MSLIGKTVVVTRALHQADGFAQKLEAAGAKVLLYPCLEIVPINDFSQLNDYNWVIFTSQNAVWAVKQLPKSIKIAAIGTSTAKAVEKNLHRKADFIPKQFDSHALTNELPIQRGERVFLPQADIANPYLKNYLESLGVLVDAVVVYKTIKASDDFRLLPYLRKEQIDIITFTSPSTVRYFLERLFDEGGTLNDLDQVCIACIGQTTKEAAQEAKLTVHITPTIHTMDGLIQSIQEEK